MPFGGPTHERLAQVDDESPQTTSSGDVWTQIQHGTCNSSANATGFDRALTYSPPFFVRAHQTTKEDCTPGTLKASQVALVEPVAYLKDLVSPDRGLWRRTQTIPSSSPPAGRFVHSKGSSKLYARSHNCGAAPVWSPMIPVPPLRSNLSPMPSPEWRGRYGKKVALL